MAKVKPRKVKKKVETTLVLKSVENADSCQTAIYSSGDLDMQLPLVVYFLAEYAVKHNMPKESLLVGISNGFDDLISYVKGTNNTVAKTVNKSFGCPNASSCKKIGYDQNCEYEYFDIKDFKTCCTCKNFYDNEVETRFECLATEQNENCYVPKEEN